MLPDGIPAMINSITDISEGKGKQMLAMWVSITCIDVPRFEKKDWPRPKNQYRNEDWVMTWLEKKCTTELKEALALDNAVK